MSRAKTGDAGMFQNFFMGIAGTVCSYKKLAIFTTNVDAENQTLINHKCVCGALNRQFLVGAVSGCGSFRSKYCRVKFALSPVRWLASSFYFFVRLHCAKIKIKCACKVSPIIVSFGINV